MEDYTNEALECSRKYWSTKLNAIKSQSSTLILTKLPASSYVEKLEY